eukprot:3234609-Lingulodinium_polyedra.AAC.1
MSSDAILPESTATHARQGERTRAMSLTKTGTEHAIHLASTCVPQGPPTEAGFTCRVLRLTTC